MTEKPGLLFLAHRIPFPPDKGDKIRSFNMLKKLSEDFDVYLGCFIDDASDQGRERALLPYCKQVMALRQHKLLSKCMGLTALATGKSITEPYYYRQSMQNWVKHIVVSKSINYAFVYSSSMAQYVMSDEYNQLHRVIDLVDVDSDKWRQYATTQSGVFAWLWRWLYQREFLTLSKLERQICDVFNHSLLVSDDEANLFKSQTRADLHHKVSGVLNGVDVEYFAPGATDIEPLSAPLLSRSVVFTGAMDYAANVDAVIWFVAEVWPQILAHFPEAHFYIVGGNPTAKVRALSQKSVTVTGRVIDVRPYILQSRCVVAPLQIARGIQNKVLEAMAMDRPVVCTYMAMEGINAPNSNSVRLTDDAQEFAEHCLALLAGARNQSTNRAWLLERFTWQNTLANFARRFYPLPAIDCDSVSSSGDDLLELTSSQEVSNAYR
ncbi:TIGR03087 family PEP-CTERM/XrtA system glycosyltransferase [Thalassotalea maritima]|uniref:TIGR03087 family PEP-CTERM/XrtA system glycosyltransferase n=1 Tax=Thalassotalea maritima TaxID=3242416 RepID=UPI0035282010